MGVVVGYAFVGVRLASNKYVAITTGLLVGVGVGWSIRIGSVGIKVGSTIRVDTVEGNVAQRSLVDLRVRVGATDLSGVDVWGG